MTEYRPLVSNPGGCKAEEMDGRVCKSFQLGHPHTCAWVQKSRLAITSSPFSSSYAYKICGSVSTKAHGQRKGEENPETCLSCARVKHPDVLPRHDVNQFAGFNVSDLDEAGLEREDVWVIQCKRLWCAFPGDFPIRPSPPAVSVDKETKVGVIEQELAIQPLDVDGLDVFFPRDKI